jgi:hypothetical protein
VSRIKNRVISKSASERAELYFAYGSNMLFQRLAERAPSAKRFAKAYLKGFKLLFNKLGSRDASGKCHVFETGDSKDIVWGVLYFVSARDRHFLDEVEGVGHGYRVGNGFVHMLDGESAFAFFYVADPEFVRPDLSPFDWYIALVIAGAIENDLPESYIASLRNVATVPDPQTWRARKWREVLTRTQTAS